MEADPPATAASIKKASGSLRWSRDGRTGRVERGHAYIPFKRRSSFWCEIEDVHRLHVRPRTLNRRISEHDILSNHVVDGTTGDVDAVGIARYIVLLDNVAARCSDEANAEIV